MMILWALGSFMGGFLLSVYIRDPPDYYAALMSVGEKFTIIGNFYQDSISHIFSAEVVKQDVHDWMKGPKISPELKLLTDEDIKYEKGGKLFLVIMGHVFDASQVAEYYRPGSDYFGHIGRDASRAFVTFKFDKESLISDLSGLKKLEYKSLAVILKSFFEDGQHVHVGYHIGRYFDEDGKETAAMKELKGWMTEAHREYYVENDLIFPPCNLKWSYAKGITEISCSKLSGGIIRDWTGLPRRFTQLGTAVTRCACVHPYFIRDHRVEKYDNCDAEFLLCRLHDTDKACLAKTWSFFRFKTLRDKIRIENIGVCGL